MRLNQRSRDIIRQTVAEIFGAGARALVFGSRLDDLARGGDIDLLVKLEVADPAVHDKELKLAARLQQRLGDQKIDVLTIQPGSQRTEVHRKALQHGIEA